MKPEEFRNIFYNALLGREEGPLLQDYILPGGKLEPNSAIAVYQNAYQARFTEVLGEKYETVWKILGDEGFFGTAKSFIEDHPSHSYNISNYGESFPNFLKENFSEHPVLFEIADFELHVFRIFHLPKNEEDNLRNSLSRNETEDLKITFHESVRFLEYSYPVYDLWKTENSEDLPQFLKEKKQYLVLGKKGSDLFVSELEEWEWTFGKSLSDGKSILESLKISGSPPKGLGSISEFLSGMKINRLVSEVNF
ncbi:MULTISPECIES: DNA-binding domain-containing protein [unclassified Leptospira]|uniref:HvfC/BufC N-terminal domain-containing protein n=1 Tax=unclassified Leptospira TaxID=2633828 RepID=UPI0002BF1689|nr:MULTISPECIES: DNA-binding domain-containing protein [unclassified Leptospira]EMK00346.1 PF09836 family protein [Leptospira sp. B5-022]MCR1793753.1 DNA-binding domain-containing protein [Leptospira sp. id769339]